MWKEEILEIIKKVFKRYFWKDGDLYVVYPEDFATLKKALTKEIASISYPKEFIEWCGRNVFITKDGKWRSADRTIAKDTTEELFNYFEFNIRDK